MSKENTKNFFTRNSSNKSSILYLAGKPRVEIIREYELTASAFDKWVKQLKRVVHSKKKIILRLNKKNC